MRSGGDGDDDGSSNTHEPSTATSIFFENPAEVVDKLCESYRY
jgi:hypothetical protein